MVIDVVVTRKEAWTAYQLLIQTFLVSFILFYKLTFTTAGSTKPVFLTAMEQKVALLVSTGF